MRPQRPRIAVLYADNSFTFAHISQANSVAYGNSLGCIWNYCRSQGDRGQVSLKYYWQSDNEVLPTTE